MKTSCARTKIWVLAPWWDPKFSRVRVWKNGWIRPKIGLNQPAWNTNYHTIGTIIPKNRSRRSSIASDAPNLPQLLSIRWGASINGRRETRTAFPRPALAPSHGAFAFLRSIAIGVIPRKSLRPRLCILYIYTINIYDKLIRFASFTWWLRTKWRSCQKFLPFMYTINIYYICIRYSII